MNMFTKNVKPQQRGRPRGRTSRGVETKDSLYQTAMRMIAQRGYEATTLRDIAKEADVSVGLLYRYFPSKQAVIIALYEQLSKDYARQAASMPPGKWRDRFIFALETSLNVLEPHRLALRVLIPVLIGDPDDGVFAAGTAFSRERVQRVFEDAVASSDDLPEAPAGCCTRQGVVSRTSRGAVVVASRQDAQTTRDRGARRVDATDAAVRGAHAASATYSTVCISNGRIDT